MTSGPKKYCEDNDVHHDGHSVRVATEVCNVVVDPLQSQQLQADVRFFSPFCRVIAICGEQYIKMLFGQGGPKTYGSDILE